VANLYGRITRPLRDHFQRKRCEWFLRVVPWEALSNVVDVGGTPDFWRRLGGNKPVTLVNSDPGELRGYEGYAALVGDGRALDFPSQSFDLAYSNSVIEHVGEHGDMEAFASELRRVGKSYWCQTPNKWFPLEPHLGTLFIHWYPPLLRIYPVVRYMTLWGVLNKPSRAGAAIAIANINMIGRRRFKALFPDAKILVERWWGMSKSFIAVRLDEGARTANRPGA